jgi:hypothetical protein
LRQRYHASRKELNPVIGFGQALRPELRPRNAKLVAFRHGGNYEDRRADSRADGSLLVGFGGELAANRCVYSTRQTIVATFWDGFTLSRRKL